MQSRFWLPMQLCATFCRRGCCLVRFGSVGCFATLPRLLAGLPCCFAFSGLWSAQCLSACMLRSDGHNTICHRCVSNLCCRLSFSLATSSSLLRSSFVSPHTNLDLFEHLLFGSRLFVQDAVFVQAEILLHKFVGCDRTMFLGQA